jgi:hypothetical protein
VNVLVATLPIATIAKAAPATRRGPASRLYERWLKTGSTVLQGELGQRGLLPLKNPGGVH